MKPTIVKLYWRKRVSKKARAKAVKALARFDAKDCGEYAGCRLQEGQALWLLLLGSKFFNGMD